MYVCTYVYIYIYGRKCNATDLGPRLFGGCWRIVRKAYFKADKLMVGNVLYQAQMRFNVALFILKY